MKINKIIQKLKDNEELTKEDRNSILNWLYELKRLRIDYRILKKITKKPIALYNFYQGKRRFKRRDK